MDSLLPETGIDKKTLIEVSIAKRTSEREEEINKLKLNREETGKENVEDCVDIFYKSFNPLISAIQEDIEISPSLPKHEITEHLDGIIKKIAETQKHVSDSSFYLPSYDKKKAQNTVNDLNDQFQSMQDKVLPKKKFGFKGKKQQVVAKTEDIVDSKPVKPASKVFSGSNDHSVRGKTGERIDLGNSDVDCKDVNLADLENCTVVIKGHPSTLHMTNIVNTTILSGPVSTSVFIEGCKNSTLALSCQQLRTHSTTDANIYLHVTSKAIVEDCKDVKFAPYDWTYEGQDEDFKAAGLDRNVNHWNEVGDFNWLAADKASPNWQILPEDQRRTDLNNL